MKGFAIIGALVTLLGIADEPQPMLIQASAPMCLTPPRHPRPHGHYERIDPEGDERTLA
jgi:hypothetical protein